MRCGCEQTPGVGTFTKLCGAHAELVLAEREACAALAETFFDGKTDNISCHQANGADKIAKAIRNRTSRARHGQRFKRAR